MTITCLPREIVDVIVEQVVLAGAKIAPLLSLSHTFRASSRHSLFRHVQIRMDLTDNKKNQPAALLLSIIQGDPDVLNSIKRLSVRVGATQDAVLKYRAGDFLALFEALLKAPLDLLKLSGSTQIDFSLLSREIALAWIALRSLPSLKTVILHKLRRASPVLVTGVNSEDPITGLTITDSVELINLPHPVLQDGFDLESEEFAPRACPYIHLIPKAHRFPALRHLEIPWPAQFLSPIRLSFDSDNASIQFPSLRYLTIKDLRDRYGDNDINAASTIIAGSPILWTLSLSYAFTVAVYDLLGPLYEAICQAPDLCNLDLICTKERWDIGPLIRNLAVFLEAISSQPTIQTLGITFFWPIHTNGVALENTYDLDMLQAPFVGMRDALSKMAALKKVVLILDFKPASWRVVRKEEVVSVKRLLDNFSIRDDVVFKYKLVTSKSQ